MRGQKMKLSKRMEMILGLAREMTERMGIRSGFAEPGCDHAYLSIELLKRGYARKVYAMDIGEGPLANARENILRELGSLGQASNIIVRRCDGISGLHPGEADALLIAGMGASTMLHILREGRKLLEGMEYILLQPQTELHEVRRYLCENGWKIVLEDMVNEEGKFYSVMAAVPCQEQNLLPEEAFLYGPVNLKEANPVLADFLRHKIQVQEKILKKLEKQKKEETMARYLQIKCEFEKNKAVFAKYF